MIGTLGRWECGVPLGAGGYAEVFACTAADGRPAALKRFRDPYYANTFEREIAALTALAGCPHTPVLLDHGRDAAGRLCIVTTRAHGEPLAQLLRTAPLGELAVRRLLEQLLALLAHAHARGWLHKDIKASNLLYDGRDFTLLDWGIAEPIGSGRAETIRSRSQDAVAPEHYQGRHGVAADFYQLGLLACHALAGRLPYHLATERSRDYRVAAHCLESAELPAASGDPQLRELIGAWLAKKPERRPVAYHLPQLLALAQPQAEDAGTFNYAHLKAEGFLPCAARAGIPYAMHEWALRLDERQCRPEALYWLEQAAAQDYARSAFLLAQWLADSQPDVAQRWLHAAAQAGVARACTLLARQSDGEDALALLRQAAAQGERQAQYRLARVLEKSGGDADEVRLWLGRAADRGQKKALERLTLERMAQEDGGTPGRHAAAARPPLLFSWAEIAELVGGSWRPPGVPTALGAAPTGISHHLSLVEPGDLFVWLNREQRTPEQGCRLIAEAGRRGAVAALVPPGLVSDVPLPLIEVAQPKRALRALARNAVLRHADQRVLVTGSHGKTGFKTQLHHLLRGQMAVHAHLDSYNLEVPVLRTLAAIPAGTAVAIVEVAVPAADIGAARARLIGPDICVITGIAPEHMKSHLSLAGLLRNKAGVVTGLRPDGLCLLNADTVHFPDLLAAVRALTDCRVLRFGTAPECEGRLLHAVFRENGWQVGAEILGERIDYVLPLLEDYAPLASVGVLLTAKLLGADLPRCVAAYRDYRHYQSSGNLYRVELAQGSFLVYDQTRRGELLGFESMFELMARLPCPGRKIAVVSEFINRADNPDVEVDLDRMRALMEKAGIDLLFTVKDFKEHAAAVPPATAWVAHGRSSDDIRDPLLAAVRPGDMVFLRGVLKAGLAQLVDQLLAMGSGNPPYVRIY